MTTEELYQHVFFNLSIKEIHQLHKAMMEEYCETAFSDPDDLKDLEAFVLAARIAFVV